MPLDLHTGAYRARADQQPERADPAARCSRLWRWGISSGTQGERVSHIRDIDNVFSKPLSTSDIRCRKNDK